MKLLMTFMLRGKRVAYGRKLFVIGMLSD